jgi:DNA modification methylase
MTELIWEGKYDKDGRKVAPVKLALPFQTVETVNESTQDRQVALDLFGRGRSSDWRNRLIWGDKKYVLPALLPEFSGKVDLIYIDPPFATGADFSFTTRIPNSETQFTKEPSIIEQKAYRDTWGHGLDSYAQWLYETMGLLRELLAPTGSIYVHCDWRVNSIARLVLDEVFGSKHFLNEVIWTYATGGASREFYARKHDTIYFYSKSDVYTFEPDRIRQDRTEKALRRAQNPIGARIAVTDTTKLPTDVWDIAALNPMETERVDYPTQKPERLISKLVLASSNPGDLVVDCFCGSGTAAMAAEKLGRRWIVADLSRFAIHTTRKRLLSMPEVQPFVVQNLGKYERQQWQAAEFGQSAEMRTVAYRRFILELYKAKPIDGYMWLHGIRGGRMVHVGTVDAPVTVGDVKQVASEFQRAVGTGAEAPSSRALDVLGWDFAFEVNEVARQQADRAGIEMHFWRIPREVLEKRAVEQGDVRFFELAALAVDIAKTGTKVQLSLRDFIIPLDDVPEDIRQVITNWVMWIDYWAIDWDNKSDTFHNQWQTYRTRKEPGLQTSASYEYPGAGEFRVVVKVIDILGNDTTKTITIQVP